ncbi:MAG TPA: MFS transporter [Burkholderiaceae bacterium]|nr:MFS transporter [Burkholderiaceae bacterium]
MTNRSGGWGELLSGRNGLRSLALAGGVALHAINVYMVTTVLPSAVRDIGGLAYYAWNMTLFVAASIFGSAVTPRLLSSMGPRQALSWAIVIFAAGSAACAMAPTMPWMLVGRSVQGLGGGLLLGLSYSCVRLLFEERLWSRAMVLVSSMWGVATLAGPAIGGVFAQAGYWRGAFWAMLPLSAGLALLVLTQISASQRSSTQPAGAPFGKIAMLVLTVMMVSVGSLSPSWYWNLAAVLGGIGLTVLIARADRDASRRLLPQGSYQPGSALASLYACIALLSIGVCTEIYIPYFLQTIHGQTPLMAGYWMVLMSAGWTLGSFMSSGRRKPVADRLMWVGPWVSAGGLVALGFLMPLGSGGGVVWVMVLPLILVGVGIGLCWPNMLTRIFKAAPMGQENIASAAITTLQLYAIALGSSMAGLVANLAGLADPGGEEGARQAAYALFLVFALAPVGAGLMSGGARRAEGA